MAQVKFYRGNKAKYNETTHANGIFFAKDTNEIILDGVTYGISATDLSDIKTKLNGAIATVGWTSPDTLTFTNVQGTEELSLTIPKASTTSAGLMSKEDKGILNTLNGEVTVAGSVKKQIADAKTALIGTSTDTKTSNTITGAKKYADAINTALDSRLDSLEAAVGEGGSVESQITDKIGDLDVPDTVVSTKYVAGVSETDGKITVTRADLVASGDKVLGTNAAGNLTATMDLTYDSTAKKIKLLGKTADDVIAEVDATAFIKDGMLSSAALVTNPTDQPAGTYIELVFNADSGKQTIYVNVTSLIDVYTAGNGLSLTSGKFAIKLASASEKYLQVTAAGLASKGIDDAISAAQSAATTEIAAKTSGHVKVSVSETSGHKVYTITESDIASAQALTDEVTRAKAAEKANTDALATLNGDVNTAGSVAKAVNDAKVAVGNYTVNSKKISGNPVLNGADIKLTGYSVVTGGALAATNTINAAFHTLDDAMTWHEA